MMSQILSRVFFVFTGFFGDVILKVGLMFPQDGQIESDCSDAGPQAARHGKQDSPRRIPIFSCPCHLTR